MEDSNSNDQNKGYSWEEHFEANPEKAAKEWAFKEKLISKGVNKPILENVFTLNESFAELFEKFSNELNYTYTSEVKKIIKGNPNFDPNLISKLKPFFDKKNNFVGFRVRDMSKSWKRDKRNGAQWSKKDKLKKRSYEWWELLYGALNFKEKYKGWVMYDNTVEYLKPIVDQLERNPHFILFKKLGFNFLYDGSISPDGKVANFAVQSLLGYFMVDLRHGDVVFVHKKAYGNTLSLGLISSQLLK